MGLKANCFAYETLRKEVYRLEARNDPHLLAFVERVANFAWMSHPGRFADGALENVAFRRGLELSGHSAPSEWTERTEPESVSRTLHVASSIYSTGGHSRVLTKWIQRDLSCSHSIVLTRQTQPLPDFLRTIWADRDVSLTSLDANASIPHRARELRALSRGFSRVILHQHPDDAVPVVAYAQAGGCPVAMFNHAHFSFSLGSTVADIIINTLPFFRALTERHRFPRETGTLSGSPGLEPLRNFPIDKERAKEQLGIARSFPVALAIASEAYFRPAGDHDFFRMTTNLLALIPDLRVLFVGVGSESSCVPEFLRRNERVHWVGRVADPTPYYQAADLCLESFPIPSLGALLESVSFGEAFPVPAYAPAENALRITQGILAKHAIRARTEPEYLAYIRQLISARADTRAKAAELRRDLISEDEKFGEQFASLYQRIDSLAHRPGEIPVAPCDAGEDSQVLASITNRDIGPAFDEWLPAFSSIKAHLRACSRGYESPPRAARRILGQLARALSSAV